MICSHDKETFIIKNKNTALIFSAQGTWDIVHVNANLIIQGNYEGL